MFFPGSRYVNLGTYTVRRIDGTLLTVTRLHHPSAGALSGYHRRLVGQRLDHIAANYLKDAAAFWRVCDAAGYVIPDALAVAGLIAIPAEER
jgi:hypothetical protein